MPAEGVGLTAVQVCFARRLIVWLTHYAASRIDCPGEQRIQPAQNCKRAIRCAVCSQLWRLLALFDVGGGKVQVLHSVQFTPTQAQSVSRCMHCRSSLHSLSMESRTPHTTSCSVYKSCTRTDVSCEPPVVLKQPFSCYLAGLELNSRGIVRLAVDLADSVYQSLLPTCFFALCLQSLCTFAVLSTCVLTSPRTR
jgi:hypothetical protein